MLKRIFLMSFARILRLVAACARRSSSLNSFAQTSAFGIRSFGSTSSSKKPAVNAESGSKYCDKVTARCLVDQDGRRQAFNTKGL